MFDYAKDDKRESLYILDHWPSWLKVTSMIMRMRKMAWF
jgi:hypothetical protein